MLAQECATLTLGQATPHTELDAIVEGIGTAFELYRAVPADRGGLALGCSSHEQIVRVSASASCSGHPGQAIFSGRNCRCRHPPPLLIVFRMSPKPGLNSLLRPHLQQTVK